MPPWLSISLVIIAICAGVLALLWLGWRHRQRTQSNLPAPADLPADLGEPVFALDDVHYVATTEIERALERIVVAPLGFRGRATIEVHPTGVALGIAGRKPCFIPREQLIAVGRAQATIDRAVERDGLIQLRWLLADDAPVDSFFRVVDPTERRDLVAALTAITPDSTTAPVVEELA